MYYLVGLYLYLNIFSTILLLKKNRTISIKLILIFLLWFLPFLGYLLNVLFLLKDELKSLEYKKKSNPYIGDIGNMILMLVVPIFLYWLVFISLG